VKRFAFAHALPLLQPQGLRRDGRFAADAADAAAVLAAASLDAIVVAAYGLLLPPWLLDLPRHGCLNLHASLLPRWRGAAPVQRAIEAGDRQTGVVLMQMDAGLDTGDMRLARATAIEPFDSAATLTARLASIAGALAVEGLRALASGDPLPARRQPADGITYAAKVSKSEASIDWREPAAMIERRLRAFDPFPGARGVLDDEIVGCWRGRALPGGGSAESRVGAGSPAAGEVVAVEPDAVVVACGDGRLAVTELQRPGGKRLAAADFLRGRPVRVGARFALERV